MYKHAIAGLTLLIGVNTCTPAFAQPTSDCITTEQVIEIGRDKLGQVPYLTLQVPGQGFLWILINKDNKTWTLLASCTPDGSHWRPAAGGQNYLDYRDKGI